MKKQDHIRRDNNIEKKHTCEILFWAVIIVVCVVLFVMSKFIYKTGKNVQVRVDGKITASYPLDVDGTYSIKGSNGGYNTLVIDNGQAYISEASCPDGLCIKQGKIHRRSQSIICLPNKVVVEITDNEGESDEQEDVDAVAK